MQIFVEDVNWEQPWPEPHRPELERTSARASGVMPWESGLLLGSAHHWLGDGINIGVHAAIVKEGTGVYFALTVPASPQGLVPIRARDVGLPALAPGSSRWQTVQEK